METLNMCNEQSLKNIFDIVKRIMSLIQIIVPIILIIWGTLSFIKLVQNPEKKWYKKDNK